MRGTLVELKATVDKTVTDGFTPLITAADEGHSDVVRALVGLKAPPTEERL